MKQNKKYLSYPKLYFESTKPTCNSNACIECKSDKGTFKFSLCSFKRREIANELFFKAKQGLFVSDELNKTVSQLFMSDEVLLDKSGNYTLNENWFASMYSYLSWQKEMVCIVLHNLAYFKSDTSNINEEEIIMRKFGLLTLVHSYLEQMVEYLVLFFSCFDVKQWLPVFYPFICKAIGNNQCSMLFASMKNLSKDVDSTVGVGMSALQIATADPVEEKTFTEINVQQEILCNMKAVSLFKRLIIDNSSNNDDLDDEFNDDLKVDDPDMIDLNDLNPPRHSRVFDMVNTIYSKLEEMVWNIKTQLAICEIRGIEQDGSGDDEEESDNKEENEDIDDNFDDYWRVDTNEKPGIRLPVPSFIRLFIIHRVLKPVARRTKISTLVSKTFMTDKDLQKMTDFVLSSLLTHGIKRFMDEIYNEEQHSNTIEIIFNEIILKQFSKEYSAIVTCSTTNSNQRLVFNTKDLMCLIFQYIYFDWKIDAYSLVSSHWLYYAWNPHSVYHCNLTEFTKGNPRYNTQNSKISRVWQRVSHAKSIIIINPRYLLFSSVLPTRRLLTMTNITKVDIRMRWMSDHLRQLKAIMQNCRKNIQDFCLHIDMSNLNSIETMNADKIPPLRLPNARAISFYSEMCQFLPIIWTNKCSKLDLNLPNVDDEWIKCVLKYCDCSCIKELNISNSAHAVEISSYIFDTYSNSESINDESINDESLNKLAQKFTGLKQFKISLRKSEKKENKLKRMNKMSPMSHFQDPIKIALPITMLVSDSNSNSPIPPMDAETLQETQKQTNILLLFWKCLWGVIKNNDTQVRLEITHVQVIQYIRDKLLEVVGDAACKIDLIDISISNNNHESKIYQQLAMELIASSRAKGLAIDVPKETQSTILKSIGEQLQVRLPMVQMIKYSQAEDSTLSDIHGFVHLNVIKKRKLFVQLRFNIFSARIHYINGYKMMFDIFCQTVFSLIVEAQVPLDITIRFKAITESEFNKIYFPIYLTYFDKEKMFKEYKEPKCNQWCRPLEFPNMQFVSVNNNNWKSDRMFRIANVSNSEC